jgi:hypothetical protein
MNRRVPALVCAVGVLAGACSHSSPTTGARPQTTTSVPAAAPPVTARRFATGFESLADFDGMYLSPQTKSTHYQLVRATRHSGARAECAWLTGPGTASDTDGPNHRGYPTVQLWRGARGGDTTPAVVDLWIWVDVVMPRGEWVSLATLSADASDHWRRVVTVNLDPGGWIDVFHVPDQGQHRPTVETHRPFPQRHWVHLSMRIDFDPQHGSIEVRQDNSLVARARVVGGHGRLEQAHFGMYASPTLTTGRVCNDDLTITAER